MAEVRPLRTLRYDLKAVGSLDAVAAPPYDVIDAAQRAELLAKSPFNVVEIDLPQDDGGGDPYMHATTTFEAWRQQGVITQEREPAVWPIEQEFVDPYGKRHVRGGFLCRVRVEDYGPGRIRPHERTQPGPKEDRLRLTRATRANLSPIFSLYAGEPFEFGDLGESFGSYTDAGGATTRLYRCGDPDTLAALQEALADRELLIADGHHRYETARVYADEVGGEGEHRYTLMALCAMSDPGLTVLPTHRLITHLSDRRRETLRETIERDFEVSPVERDDLEPPHGDTIELGYYDGHHRRPLRLKLRDPEIAQRALADRPEPYRRLDTAFLEQVILCEALGLSEEDIARQDGITYAKRADHAIEAVESGTAQAAFFMSATPVGLVQEVAEAGESMPPKSTFFYPKIPTGLVFNPLD
jgi:uncharacterized protein (DUF1015 family)